MTNSTYKPDICVYHHPCQDGIAAAWAIWKRWPDCQFIPASYGKQIEWPSIADKHILFVDFSLKRSAMLSMAGVISPPASVTILDHHKTAEAELRDLPEGFTTIFDMNKSGARLAYEFAHPGQPIPRIIELVEDRDLWRFKFGDETRDFAAFMRGEFLIPGLSWVQENLAQCLKDGAVMRRYHDHIVNRLVAHVAMREVAGHTNIPTVNVPFMFASDCCDLLLKAYPDAPFVASFFVKDDGALVYSLRSTDERMDVSAIAAKFGGGGHRNAAGFSQ